MRLPHKKRIQVAVELLSEFTKYIDILDRSKAVEELKRVYSEKKLKPIKGKATPPDLHDKEMATLYVVAKYGLMLDADFPDLIEKVFYVEKTLDEAIQNILNGAYETAREKLRSVSSTGGIDSNIVARMLRIPLTKYVLGFASEEEMKEALRRCLEALPEEDRTVRNYARFFIALKLAEMIYKGEIKTREEKEAYKKALAIRIGFPKSTPGDDYIREVAKSVFEVSDSVLEKILTKSQEQKGQVKEGAD